MEVSLCDHVERVAFAFGPLNEVAVILRPAGRSVIIAKTVRVGPFLDWITRRGEGPRLRRNRNARRALGQPDRAARPGAQKAQNRRELIPIRTVNAYVVTRASPVVVGGPRRRRQDHKDTAPSCRRRRTDDEKMMLDERAAVLAQTTRYDAIEA